MGLLSDFFIADASPIPRYDGGEGFDDADKCQFKGLTPLQGGQLLALFVDRFVLLGHPIFSPRARSTLALSIERAR